MQDSRMMADTGCMPKVSGSRSDTPLGAPRPGSTPTRMLNSTPPTISTRWGTVSAIVKPCSSASKFSMALQVQCHAEQPVRQRDLEQSLEHDVEGDCGNDRNDKRAQHAQSALE